MAGCKPRINPEIYIGSGWQPLGEWKKTYQLSILSRLFQSSPTNRCCHQGKSELMLININFIRYHKMLFISSSFKIERTYSWKYTLCLMPGHLKITRAERAKLKPKFLNEWMNEKKNVGLQTLHWSRKKFSDAVLNGITQSCRKFIVSALELLQSNTKPLTHLP